MAVTKKNGVTTKTGTDSLASQIVIGPDGKPTLPGYNVALNADGGYTVTKKNKLYDIGIPLAVGAMFAGGPFLQGGAAAASAAGSMSNFGLPANVGSTLGVGVGPASAAVSGAGTLAAGAGAKALATTAGALSGRDWLNLAMFGGQALLNNSATNKEIAASDKSAQIQADQDQKALDLLKQQWETDQANLAPYYAMGKTATGKLSDSLASSAPPGALPPQVQQLLSSGYAMPPAGGGRPSTMASFGQPPNSAMAPTATAQPPQTNLTPFSASIQQPGAPQQTMSQALVPLQAPDGSVRMVAAAKVPYYKQKWASMGAAA